MCVYRIKCAFVNMVCIYVSHAHDWNQCVTYISTSPMLTFAHAHRISQITACTHAWALIVKGNEAAMYEPTAFDESKVKVWFHALLFLFWQPHCNNAAAALQKTLTIIWVSPKRYYVYDPNSWYRNGVPTKLPRPQIMGILGVEVLRMTSKSNIDFLLISPGVGKKMWMFPMRWCFPFTNHNVFLGKFHWKLEGPILK